MSAVTDAASQLLIWTPYLAEGFGMNILISILAMTIGTVLGLGVARMRLAASTRVYRTSLLLTELTRNVPTFVFMYYLAFMMPSEFTLPSSDTLVTIPAWVKASLALSIAVIGFCADNLTQAIREWRSGNHGAAWLFIPAWTSYALIIVMASSTASVIGVSELVSRCNTVVNATGNTSLMLPVYLYACVFFIGFCYPLIRLMDVVKARIVIRLGNKDLA